MLCGMSDETFEPSLNRPVLPGGARSLCNELTAKSQAES